METGQTREPCSTQGAAPRSQGMPGHRVGPGSAGGPGGRGRRVQTQGEHGRLSHGGQQWSNAPGLACCRRVSSGHGRRGSKCRCGLDPEGSLDFRRQAVGRQGGDLGWGSRHVKTRERTVKPEASGSGQLRAESCHLGERTSKWLPTTEGASVARSHGEADLTPRLLDDGVGSCGQPERVLRVCRGIAGNITGEYRLG